ncbi:MAG TPA: hypothetical protein VMF91_16610 [Bryobacteraceae bacterium]|nr:hypothetical protein [Bryobacteraceae bacterium]
MGTTDIRTTATAIPITTPTLVSGTGAAAGVVAGMDGATDTVAVMATAVVDTVMLAVDTQAASPAVAALPDLAVALPDLAVALPAVAGLAVVLVAASVAAMAVAAVTDKPDNALVQQAPWVIRPGSLFVFAEHP